MFSESAAYDFYASHGGSGISAGNYYSSSASTLSNSKPGISRTAEMFNTYYIYTFDGKLLAEYDHNGNCVRDYIYFGDRLLAEYKPQTGEYFYYMTDQINSTRIITDDSGNVVFSEAYGPYGDVQKTWVNTYNPKLKFSGKEREGYSDLDYFGARYYDHKSYRFNSVDPVINKAEALTNPQAWNLYAYCRNNPITFFDPTGEEIEIKSKELITTFEYTLGIRLKFENKDRPDLVTGFTVKHNELKEILGLLQEIIDDPHTIIVSDLTGEDYYSITLAVGGGSFDPGVANSEAKFDRNVTFRYSTGFLSKNRIMPLGEKMIHDIIGHGYTRIKKGYSYMKNKKKNKDAIEKFAIGVTNKYRKHLGLPERGSY